MSTRKWQQSSACQEGEACLQVAVDDGTIRIRESQAPAFIVTSTPEQLKEFIGGIKKGDFEPFADAALLSAPLAH